MSSRTPAGAEAVDGNHSCPETGRSHASAKGR